jgi:nitrile hydratase
MREFGCMPPEGTRVAARDGTADVRHMILPMRPSGTEGMDVEELSGLVTRGPLIGVNAPRTPAAAQA